MSFEANPSYALQTLHFGIDQVPVIVVDDFLADPDALVAFAATEARFGAPKNWYPGLRAEPLPQAYVMEAIRALHTPIGEVFGLPKEGDVNANAYFGLATLAPEALSDLQRLPHFDTANPRQVALLHYLCDARHGGTSFYRQRSTGFEAVRPDRERSYYTTLESDLRAKGRPPARYMSGDDDLFEEIGRVEARFNRLVVYPSCALHSANVNVEAGLSADPRQGRLTANIFLAYR
jgi:hypothetical protein